MTANPRSWTWGVALLVLLAGATAWAAEGKLPVKAMPYNPADATVEMFAGMEKGDIAVKLIPDDSTHARVLIENKTDKPLNVKLPDAFAGVPRSHNEPRVAEGLAVELAAEAAEAAAAQTTGGGMGMGGGGMGGMGMMNIPAEKVGKVDVTTVCLEHGKHEPRAQIPYEIKPLANVTTKPGVLELCQMLGNGQLNQRAAQAAAWHLNNGMSWQDLAAKRYHRLDGSRPLYFSPAEIQAGMAIASNAERVAAERKQQDDARPSVSQSQR